MKKSIIFILTLVLTLTLFTGCQKEYENKKQISEQTKMIMLKDEMWYSTGTEISMDVNENDIQGKIESSVKETNKPTQNEESNFEKIGSSYSFIDDQVLVCLDGKWILFVDENTWDNAQGDISVKGAIVVGYEKSDKSKIFGDLNDEEIKKITDKIVKKVKSRNEDESNNEIIEKVFRESGIENSSQIEAAKSKITISEP